MQTFTKSVLKVISQIMNQTRHFYKWRLIN